MTSGFTSATAIIIVVSQVKSLLGLSFTAESVLDNVSLIYEQWHSVRIPDVLLGIVCCTALLLLRVRQNIFFYGVIYQVGVEVAALYVMHHSSTSLYHLSFTFLTLLLNLSCRFYKCSFQPLN